jgi:hypothetical protein
VGVQLGSETGYRILGSLLARFDAYVENVAATKDNVSIVRSSRIATVLRGTFENDVHVTIGVDHSASIFDITLESNTDLSIELFNEQVERFSGRLQAHHWITTEPSSLR